MKHLSPDEQRVLLMAQRHRAEYLRRMKRFRAITRSAKHTFLIASCVAGFFAGTPGMQAADAPAVSAPALFNEANAEQRAGRLGSAILHYERAQWLAPGDRAIATNLRAAREKAGVTGPAVPAWQRPAHWLGFNSLAALASISLLLLCLLVFGTRLIPTTLRLFARGVAATFGVTALVAASAVVLRWPELNRAVVQSTGVVARIAPADAAAGVFELKAGDVVQAGHSHGDFIRVQTADARSGWVAKSVIDRIIPSDADVSPM